ncbi:MAG: PKD domain-containing protein [Candidatus Micrarchaeales archaeon]
MGYEKIAFPVSILALLMLTTISGAQSVPSVIANPVGSLELWLPIVTIAVFISVAIGALIYILGKFLNDPQISARGITEIGQSVGTMIFAVIIVAFLIFFGTFIANSPLVGEHGIAPALTNICSTLGSASLNIANSMITDSPTSVVCSAAGAIKGGQISYVDYGLSASYLIIANLTNQAANNINALYQYESYIGFLSTLTSSPGLCLPSPACAVPITPRILSISLTSTPFAGYGFISSVTRPLETQAIFIMYMLLTQLIIVFMVLLVWPWLLAAGIVLRAIPFTRSAGGLLMGITLAIVIIYPIVSIVEYGALGNGVSTSQIIGAPVAPPITWDWGDRGSTSTGDSVYHLYGSPGVYTVTATVHVNGQTYSASKAITMQSGGSEVDSIATSTSGQQQMSFNYDTDGLLISTQINSIAGLQQLVGTALYGLPTSVLGPDGSPKSVQGPAASLSAQQLQSVVTYSSLTPNFYVFPNIEEILNYNGCWINGGLGAEEAHDSALMAATLGLGAAFSFGGFVAAPPALSGILATQCVPGAAITTTLEMTDVYGLMSVSGFILPMLTILIVIAAIKNISYLFGGDTDLAGIGKLV